MLISVNGTIIDTKNIYTVTKIKQVIVYEGSKRLADKFHFQIISLGGEKLNVSLGIWPGEEEKIEIKVIEFRESIVKIWQENQSEIPQFNL